MRAGCALLCSLLLLAACAEDDAPPHATFGGGGDERACDEPHACVNARTSETAVHGLRVIHKHMPGEPIASIRLLFDGGASAWSSGGAHAEALAFIMLQWWGGRAHAENDEFQAAQARIGAQFSATSGSDFANASLVVPVEYFEQGFELLARTVVTPFFTLELRTEALDHVRSAYRQRFELDEPDAAAQQGAWGMVFAGHPYNFPAEQLARLGGVGLLAVRTAFDQLRRRERMIVVVAGDVERARVDALVSRELGDVMAGAPGLVPLPPAHPSADLADRAVVLPYPEAPNWHISACFPAPAPGHPDYLPLLLALGALDARLFDALRSERALVYTTGARLADYRVNWGSLWFSTAKPGEALAVFHTVLREAQSTGFDAAQLADARALYTTEFLAEHERTTSITWTLANWQLTANDRTLADQHLRALEDVTPEDATRVLATYLPELRYAAAGAGEPLDEAMLRGMP